MNVFDLYTLIDVITVVVLYVLFFVPKWSRSAYELFIKSCFYVYIVFVACFTLIIPVVIPIPMVNINLASIHANIVPYIDVVNGYRGAMMGVVLNILMFIPFGILYPFVYHKNFKNTFAAATVFTFGVEIIQLFSARGVSACDITDVINNLFGAVIGYCVYIILRKPADKLLKSFLQK